MTGYPKIEPKRKTGLEEFHNAGRPIGLKLADFWRWYVSDLVSNATRGALAEFIVATALDVGDSVREEWRPFDVLSKSGKRIEVKSAAYLQTWYHEKLSSISFQIGPTRAWDSSTNLWSSEIKRQADAYVFAVLSYQKKDEHFDPMNLEQWDFYILKAAVLDERCSSAKTISLKSLLRLNPRHVGYEELAVCIESL